MRDALSFFDQLVSFSGDKLTYETVTEHLNILDNTYYFRILDQVLSQDTAGVLLTINEIIDRGFDGQHFLIGLGEHLRSLLVCKDAATVMLLEISANLQQKYIEQAGRCSPAFLLKALEIHNQFDQSYKTSNNKRLQLELALLQICTSAVATSPAAGEKKNLLIPPEGIKTQEISNPMPAVARTEAKKTSTQPPPPPPPSPPSPQSFPGSRTISIRPENHLPKKIISGENGVDPQQLAQSDFSQDKLEKVWLYYTESIAQQYPNFYSILSTRKPLLKDNLIIELTIDNKAQELTLKERRNDLLDFLRAELRNQKIQLETNLIENVSQSKPYTAEDKYRVMAEKNPALKALRESLDLELEL
jgi:DNA polymerase-3 subunit gamma/tau